MKRVALLLTPLVLLATATAAAPTFGDSVTVASGADLHPTEMAAAASGNHLYVAWVNVDNDTAHDLWFRSIKANGAPDGPIVRLMTERTLSLDPTIAASGDTIGVAWLENDHDNPQNDDVVYFQRSGDGGKTWQPRQDLVPHAFGFQDTIPHLIAVGDRFYLTYEEFDDVWLMRSDDLGVTWRPAVKVTDGTHYLTSWGNLYADETGLYGVYEDRNRVLLRKSSDGGQTWSDEVVLSNDDRPKDAPRIAGDGQRIVVQWWQRQGHPRDFTIGRIVGRMSRNHGESFGPTRRISGAIPARSYGDPDIAFALGTFTAAWQDRYDTLTVAFSARGIAWRTRVEVKPGAQAFSMAEGEGALWLAYVVYDGGYVIEARQAGP